jgi:hypothetical protein
MSACVPVGTFEQQNSGCCVLRCYPYGLVERQLGVVGASFAVTGDEFAEFGVDLVGSDDARVDRSAELHGARRRFGEDSRSCFDHHESVAEGCAVDLSRSGRVVSNRVHVRARGQPLAFHDGLVGMGGGAHDVGGTRAV